MFSGVNFIFLALVQTSFIAVCQEVRGGNNDYVSSVNNIMNQGKPHFIETFNSGPSLPKKWIVSEAKKEGVEEDIAKYDGDWTVESPAKNSIEGDYGLVFKQKAKHRAISAKLQRDFTFATKPLILQYEVLFQENQECGGAYLKLLSKSKEGSNLKQFHDKTPYTIMFGPDKCGNTHKVHFIFRHRNPINGSYEEKHNTKAPSTRIDQYFNDAQPHLYTLVVYPDNTFQILIDQEVIVKGSLLEDFSPPVNPPATIDDPEDVKPEDWDDREKIPDPSATKPDDWDESAPRTIPDPNAVKPENWLESEPLNIIDPTAEKPHDWDEAMDGVWEAPLVPNPACEEVAGCGPWAPPQIDNPNYMGKWSPPLITNPAYKGQWAAKKIPNPDFFEDKEPFKMTDVIAVGFELWSMSANILFDNILLTDDEDFARKWTTTTFDQKKIILTKNAATLWMRMMKSLNYKPGWWSLYFAYCFLPVGLYVWFLLRRVKEDTALNQFLSFTNKYPWLWAAYTIVLLLTVTLLVYCCCWTGKDAAQERTKKTDGDVKSDVEELEVEEQNTKNESAAVRRRRQVLKNGSPEDKEDNEDDGNDRGQKSHTPEIDSENDKKK